MFVNRLSKRIYDCQLLKDVKIVKIDKLKMRFKPKEKVIKEIIIFKCSFCKNNSISKQSKWYYCADNKCATKLWAKESC